MMGSCAAWFEPKNRNRVTVLHTVKLASLCLWMGRRERLCVCELMRSCSCSTYVLRVTVQHIMKQSVLSLSVWMGRRERFCQLAITDRFYVVV